MKRFPYFFSLITSVVASAIANEIFNVNKFYLIILAICIFAVEYIYRLKEENKVLKQTLSNIQVKKDREIFEKIATILPADGNVVFLRNCGFGSAFNLDEIKEIDQFAKTIEVDKIGYTFRNEKLEQAKNDLYNAVKNFQQCINRYTFPTVMGLQAVYPELKYDEDKRKVYEDALNETCIMADNFIEKYDVFRKLGREILDI